MHYSLSSRIIGYAASLVLTLVAFLIIFQPGFFNLGTKDAIFVILILALLQFIVQSVCFLNVWKEKGPRWNLVVFVSTISIILIILVASIWIMHHLNCNMMM